MLDHLLSALGPAATASDLAAALCLLTGVDPTLLPLSATTSGRVLASMGRMAAGGYGSLHINPPTESFTDVPVQLGIEPQLPAEIEIALIGAGVEADVLASLYFDEQHGQMFRQRIKSKWQVFVSLASRSLIQSPTGFFVSAVRKNWHLSSSYEPGKKKELPAVRVILPSAKEEAATLAQQVLDASAEATPAEQWRDRGQGLRFLLRGLLSAPELLALERACTGGLLRAADLARAAAAASAGGTLSGWAGELRSSL